MAMMRPRRPTLRTQPSFRPVYQDFKPQSDMSENPEAHVLKIYLPGFTKERIRVQYDGSSQLMKVSGERPIDGGNRRSRFREAYPVPPNCIITQIQSNCRQGTLTITMPKKIISQAEVKPTQEEALAGPPSQKAEQDFPPKSAATQQETRDYQKTASSPPLTSGTGPDDMKATPSQRPIIDSQMPEKELTMAVAEKKEDGVPQTVQKETDTKPTLKLDQGKVEEELPQKVQQEMDEKHQKGKEESEAKPKLEMVPRDKMDEKPQKGQEETELKPTSEMVPRKSLDEKPERGHEGTNQKATLTSIPGEQSGEKPGERRGDDVEKERISNKEIIEGKPSESRKNGNGVKEKSTDTEKEITERRELVQAGEHSVPKIPEKGKQTTSKAEAAAAAKEWNLNDGMIGTIGKGVVEVTTAASQAFTRIAEGKWDNEDKPLLLNMGASILVLAAVGGYALYKFSSSLRN